MDATLVPIVLVHGLIGSLDAPAVLAQLAPHPVAAPPLLGYGVHAGVEPATISLPAQAEHLRRCIAGRFGDVPVHLVGHSVGGVVAALLAHAHPELVVSLVSVEGNFTLKDAFWSAAVGRMCDAEAVAMLDGFRADPAGWLARSGIAPTPDHLAVAARWLANQPASTLRAMGRSVVETTEPPGYETLLREVFARVPVHLLAGERSRAGWDVPDWAMEQAASHRVLPGAGHMMMLDDGPGFGRLLAGIVGTSARSSDAATRMLSGQCVCGAVCYEVPDAFRYAANCHCPDCRKATGSAFKPFAGIERDKLRLTRGSDQLFLYGDEHGHDVRCKGCASLLYSVVREGAFAHVALGSLDDEPTLCPTAHIFVGCKAGWFTITDGLSQYEEYKTVQG